MKSTPITIQELDLLGARQVADVARRNMWRIFYEHNLSQHISREDFAFAAAKQMGWSWQSEYVNARGVCLDSREVFKLSKEDAIHWEEVFKKISAAINTKAEWIKNLRRLP